MSISVIRALLAARHVTFAIVVILLVVLVWAGKRVSYEQSINSFFAEDDPAMRVYQTGGPDIRRRQLRFRSLRRHGLLTPDGLNRVSELAAAVAPDRIPGVQRVESLDAMPLLWAIDDALLALDRLPSFARNMALNAAQRTVKDVDLKTNAMTVNGAVKAAGNDPAALAALKDRLDTASAFPWDADRLERDVHRGRGPIAEDKPAQRDRDGCRSSRRGRSIRGAARAGPAGGRRPAGASGRRLRGDRDRRPSAGRRRHDPDRRGDAIGSSEPLVGDRPDASLAG